MRKVLIPGIILFVGTGLLLAGCSMLNGTKIGSVINQALRQPTSTSVQNVIEATPTDAYAGVNQGAADANQALNDLQSTLQAEDISDPGSLTDQSLNDTAQGVNSLLQTVIVEPTP